MTRRIILNPQGLRISRRGIDVIGATPEQLLFSSDINYPKLVEKGTFVRQSNTSEPPVVWFSKNYPIAPMIFFMCQPWEGNFYTASAYVFGDGNGYNRFQCRQDIDGIMFNTPYYWWAYV